MERMWLVHTSESLAAFFFFSQSPPAVPPSSCCDDVAERGDHTGRKKTNSMTILVMSQVRSSIGQQNCDRESLSAQKGV